MVIGHNFCLKWICIKVTWTQSTQIMLHFSLTCQCVCLHQKMCLISPNIFGHLFGLKCHRGYSCCCRCTGRKRVAYKNHTWLDVIMWCIVWMQPGHGFWRRFLGLELDLQRNRQPRSNMLTLLIAAKFNMSHLGLFEFSLLKPPPVLTAVSHTQCSQAQSLSVFLGYCQSHRWAVGIV